MGGCNSNQRSSERELYKSYTYEKYIWKKALKLNTHEYESKQYFQTKSFLITSM